ncbi:OFA family MFS transporter [Gemmatimonas sp.]|jgi:MFS family permease|uniref:OFA family MFS transporter n=1 Tax=Gemmatimonas sp. TaxID=1962908 RepID=UPI0037C01F3D
MLSTPPPRRWTIPLGAVLVHLGIGSVYAWSTLNRPIAAAMPSLPWWASPPYTTFTSALVLLGLSAATWGPWVERRGARIAARLAALCFASGLAVGAVGLHWQQPLLLFLGLGILCGMGCGIGYIAPVSTLVKWFPDRRGMATGFAIMGFGGGAFVAGYANAFLIERVGVANTLFILGGVYLLVMLAGAQLLRPAPLPETAGPGAASVTGAFAAATHPPAVAASLTRRDALRTPQFALLWGMLCINVTAGIGILAQASPMMQDLFGRTPAQAAAVVAMISVFNAGGRLFWSTISDRLGRRNTYLVFFGAQLGLFLIIPQLARTGSWWPFLVCLLTVFTMYGGGFATIPAFLADLFGTANVGAIHGALLTAWSVAAVLGPVIITELSERARAALAPGMSRVAIYDQPLQLLAALLGVGLLLTLLVRPLRASRS